MLKNKFRFLVFVLVICLSVTTVFAKQTKVGKTVSKVSGTYLSPQTSSLIAETDNSLKLFRLKNLNNPFWGLTNQSLLANSAENQEGPVYFYTCYVACRTVYEPYVCRALCSLGNPN